MRKFLQQEINCVFIMLGSSCNFQCKYCMQHPLIHDQITAEINPETIEFLQELAENQGRPVRLQFYGGEPLLYWNNIVAMVEALEGCNVQFSMISNGALLTMDKVDFMNKHNFDTAISWDGVNVEETRGKDVFADNEIKECIFNLNNLCVSAVMSSRNYPLSLLEQTDKLNQEYAAYRKNNNLPEAPFYTVIDEIMDTGLEHKYLTEIDCDKVYSDMAELCSHYEKQARGEEDYNPFYANYISRYVTMLCNRVKSDVKFAKCRCSNGYQVLNLDLDGNLYRCHNSHTKLGTIRDNYFSYLENVIHYDGTKQFNEKCKDCCVQDICFNGCPLVDQEVRDKYYCEMKQAVFYPVFEMVMRLGGD